MPRLCLGHVWVRVGFVPRLLLYRLCFTVSCVSHSHICLWFKFGSCHLCFCVVLVSYVHFYCISVMFGPCFTPHSCLNLSQVRVTSAFVSCLCNGVAWVAFVSILHFYRDHTQSRTLTNPRHNHSPHHTQSGTLTNPRHNPSPHHTQSGTLTNPKHNPTTPRAPPRAP